MTNAYPPKFADEVLDYSWNWSARLEEDETITGVEVSKSDDSVEIDRVSTVDGKTTFWINDGGRVGMPLRIYLLATTSAARKIGATLVVPIQAR